MTPTRRRWLLGFLVATVVALLLFPFRYEVTPAWSFDVVGFDGKGLPNCAVQEHWEWVAVGLQRGESSTSDAAGHVRFPARTVRASIGRQWLGAARNFGFHSAYVGPRAYFLGCGTGRSPERLDAEKVGSEIVYRYVPGLSTLMTRSSGK